MCRHRPWRRLAPGTAKPEVQVDSLRDLLPLHAQARRARRVQRELALLDHTQVRSSPRDIGSARARAHDRCRESWNRESHRARAAHSRPPVGFRPLRMRAALRAYSATACFCSARTRSLNRNTFGDQPLAQSAHAGRVGDALSSRASLHSASERVSQQLWPSLALATDSQSA